MFNNVLDRKESFFGNKNFNLLKSQKSHFSKGVNSCFWSKNVVFFLELFSVKIGPEILLNSVRDRKQTFFGPKKTNLSKTQKIALFQRG